MCEARCLRHGLKREGAMAESARWRGLGKPTLRRARKDNDKSGSWIGGNSVLANGPAGGSEWSPRVLIFGRCLGIVNAAISD